MPTQRENDKVKKPSLRENRRRSQGIGTLLFLVVLSFVALWVFIEYAIRPGGDILIDKEKLFSLQKKGKTPFKLGNVSMDMTSDKIRNIFPTAALGKAKGGLRGEEKGRFLSEGGKYSVWFLKPESGGAIYKIKLDQTFKTFNEEDILAHINKKYGLPAYNNCTKRSVANVNARKCRFRWWPTGGVSLDLESMDVPDPEVPGKTKTIMTLVATDTRMQGKRLRERAKKNTLKIDPKSLPSRPKASPNKTESLPF
jgi:hypothetical protein